MIDSAPIVPEAVKAIVNASRERWARGIDSFTRLLDKSMEARRPAAKVIRSAVYGDMKFSAEEMFFIESFYLQRMRRVSQMGLMNLVYPDARHSRFEHSLGVLYSLKSLLRADPDVSDLLSPMHRRTLYFAALLHDCGHGPFSHTTESLLDASGLDLMMRPLQKGQTAKVKPHERRGRAMILDEDFHLEHLEREEYGLKRALMQFDVDPSSVAGLIVGDEVSPMANLLSGDFDVDKMDYFRRDAFFTGTMGGGVDMEALQRWIRVYGAGTSSPKATFAPKVVGHVLHMMFAREHVYGITAYHPAARVAAALLLVSGDVALRALPTHVGAFIFSHIELLDDQELLTVLQIAADAERSRSRDGELILLTLLLERLYLRRLLKRLCTLSREEFLQCFNRALPTLAADKNELPQLAYCRISSIAGGKYTHLLVDKADDVAILDMSPQRRGLMAGMTDCTAEAAMFDGVWVESEEAGSPPTSLTHWLDANAGPGAALAQASALRAYKLSLWRALVLVPTALKRELRAQNLTEPFIRDFAEALADHRTGRPVHKSGFATPTIATVGEQVKAWTNARVTKMSHRLREANLEGRKHADVDD